MKTSEEIIDQVLSGLRDTQAPAGMEDRVLQAIQDRASSASFWSRWRVSAPLALIRPMATRPWTWGIATAGVVAVSVSLATLSSHRHDHKIVDSSKQPVLVKPQTATVQTATAEYAPTSHAMPIKRVAARKETQKVQPLSEEDALALSEMRAPSHPAPEMPLTDQERLMLRIVRGGDPVELAELDPQVRAAQDAQQKAEFQNFFEPPRTGDKE